MLLPPEVNNFPYSSVVQSHESNSDYYMMLFGDQGQIGSLNLDVSLTIAQKQKFTIRELCPDWGYATETTKVCFISYYSIYGGAPLGDDSDVSYSSIILMNLLAL